jgi:hypothetical protein
MRAEANPLGRFTAAECGCRLRWSLAGSGVARLRQLGDHLRAACAGPAPGLQEARNVLEVALSLLHASVMDNLARTQQLWVHRVRTDHRGQEIETWIREPPGTFEGQPLLRSASEGHQALDDAVRRLIRPTGSYVRQTPPDWPREPAVERSSVPCAAELLRPPRHRPDLRTH